MTRRRRALARTLLPLVIALVCVATTSQLGARQAPAPTGAAATAAATPKDAKQAPTLVLVELFTSEGCSSCPPADYLLAQMVAQQPLPGVEIIALGFHVDYWDRLGWRDQFSSPVYTMRQNDYAERVGWQKVYTPQAVVDGARECLGSDWEAARKAITESAAAAKLAVRVSVDPQAAPDAAAKGKLPVRVEVDAPASPLEAADVLLAVAEDSLVTDVKRGENAKKRLSHVAVVRSFDRIGKFDGKQAVAITRQVDIDADWQRNELKLIVVVQAKGSRKVIGLASRRAS